MIVKYEIRTNSADGSLWGWSYTREKAFARAKKLSRNIRTDIPVCVVLNGQILGQTKTNSGPGGIIERPVIATP